MWAFNTVNINEKINVLRASANYVISNKKRVQVPLIPARDAKILEFKEHPPKKGFSSKEGQARMLHDLASIELQAMELGIRTLAEFPELPEQFKEDLWKITLSEAEHLEMCLNEINALGFSWGDWPVNCGLWMAVSVEDSILDRVLIVHRYLEGSGIEAGDTLIKRLAAVDCPTVKKAMKIINEEEIEHVRFGNEWYLKFCKEQNIEADKDFISRMDKLRSILPKRVTPINYDLRKKAGFTDEEISYFEKLRESFLEKNSVWQKKL